MIKQSTYTIRFSRKHSSSFKKPPLCTFHKYLMRYKMDGVIGYFNIISFA